MGDYDTLTYRRFRGRLVYASNAECDLRQLHIRRKRRQRGSLAFIQSSVWSVMMEKQVKS